MPVRITFKTDNAAFEYPGGSIEAAHILRQLATRIENGRTEGGIMDSNGNSIGTFTATFPKEGR